MSDEQYRPAADDFKPRAGQMSPELSNVCEEARVAWEARRKEINDVEALILRRQFWARFAAAALAGNTAQNDPGWHEKSEKEPLGGLIAEVCENADDLLSELEKRFPFES